MVEWIAHPVVPIALAEVTEYLSVGCLVFESVPLSHCLQCNECTASAHTTNTCSPKRCFPSIWKTSTKKGSYLNSKLEASLGHIERLHLRGKLISSDDGLLGPFLCHHEHLASRVSHV